MLFDEFAEKIVAEFWYRVLGIGIDAQYFIC